MRINGPYIHKTGRLKGRKYLNIIHDDGKKTSILYSRWIMEQYLNRKLAFDETVDHIDNDFTNDDLTNLQVITRSQNAAKWHIDMGNEIEWFEFICPWCNQPGKQQARNVRSNRNKTKAGPFCGRSCAGKWSKAQQLGRVA